MMRRAAALPMCLPVLLACGQTVISIERREEPERQRQPDSGTGPRSEQAPEPTPGLVPSDGADAQAPVPPSPVPEQALEPDLELGLLLHLRFDETEAGATAIDTSGNGHDGTPSTNPPTPSATTPAVGFDNPRCLDFAGVDQLVDLGNPSTLDVAGELTISAWVRPRALDGYRNIVAHGFRWMPDQEIALRISDGYYHFLSWSGVNQDHVASAPVPEGDLENWHHLAGVFDGQVYRLYRDGVLLSEQQDSFAPSNIDAPWAIGGRSATTPAEPRHFDGLIDEVRIYGRALSEEEVGALFRR